MSQLDTKSWLSQFLTACAASFPATSGRHSYMYQDDDGDLCVGVWQGNENLNFSLSDEDFTLPPADVVRQMVSLSPARSIVFTGDNIDTSALLGDDNADAEPEADPDSPSAA